MTIEAPSPVQVGLYGCCPRCGAKTLFSSFATFARSCRACGLDFSAFNVGDGPAAFLTLIVGTIVTVLAVWFELALEPPWWMHLVLWVPIVLVAVLGSLRVAKGMLIALEYRNRASEGRIVERD